MGPWLSPLPSPWLSPSLAPGWWLVPWGGHVPHLLPSLPSLGCMRLAAAGWGLVTLSQVMPPRAGTATIDVTSSLGPQIKRFLKEDSEEAELTQLLRDCPPADSPRKVEPPESWREPGHPLCGVGRVPPDELADERDARIFSRSRPLDFQQHIAAPPPPSPNRPRSPWGQLDPYDSSEVQDVSPGSGGTRSEGLQESRCRMFPPSELKGFGQAWPHPVALQPWGTPRRGEGKGVPCQDGRGGMVVSPVPCPLCPQDDKEYVGFATLPNQVHRKSVKKGFDFTLMVAGTGGLSLPRGMLTPLWIPKAMEWGGGTGCPPSPLSPCPRGIRAGQVHPGQQPLPDGHVQRPQAAER